LLIKRVKKKPNLVSNPRPSTLTTTPARARYKCEILFPVYDGNHNYHIKDLGGLPSSGRSYCMEHSISAGLFCFLSHNSLRPDSSYSSLESTNKTCSKVFHTSDCLSACDLCFHVDTCGIYWYWDPLSCDHCCCPLRIPVNEVMATFLQSHFICNLYQYIQQIV
jgi:hypothetical protein